MRTIKKTILQLPEYLLILAVLFYWVSASKVINPIAIGLLAILVIQIYTKNKVIGLIIPTVLILICCYMLLALFSEFNEFPTFNSEAKTLLFIGLSFFLSTILTCLIMIYKYLSTKI